MRGITYDSGVGNN